MQEFIARPLSLSMRLFGNILGEDTVLAIFIGFSRFYWDLFLYGSFTNGFLALLCSTIQAMIFLCWQAFISQAPIGVYEEEEDSIIQNK